MLGRDKGDGMVADLLGPSDGGHPILDVLIRRDRVIQRGGADLDRAEVLAVDGHPTL